MFLIKNRGGFGYSEVVGGIQTTTCEDYDVLDFRVSRHLIEKCTCSYCQPYNPKSWKKLPPPGKFEISVPPADNKWDARDSPERAWSAPSIKQAAKQTEEKIK